MAKLTREWIDDQRKRQEETLVAETKSGLIVLAHPGQKLDRDPKFLKHNFGLTPDIEVKRLIDTPHSAPFERWERELASQHASLDDQVLAAERHLAELRTRRGDPPPPPPKTKVDDDGGDPGDPNAGPGVLVDKETAKPPVKPRAGASKE